MSAYWGDQISMNTFTFQISYTWAMLYGEKRHKGEPKDAYG